MSKTLPPVKYTTEINSLWAIYELEGETALSSSSLQRLVDAGYELGSKAYKKIEGN